MALQEQATVKVSDWMGGIDSHTIYDHAALMADLEEHTDATVIDGDVVKVGERTAYVPGVTVRDLRRTQGAVETGNPKGAYFPEEIDPDLKVIAGFSLARALANGLAGHTPGDDFYGRGTAYRANVRALKEAGF